MVGLIGKSKALSVGIRFVGVRCDAAIEARSHHVDYLHWRLQPQKSHICWANHGFPPTFLIMNLKSFLFACGLGLLAFQGVFAQDCNAVEVTGVMSVGLFGEEIAWSIVDLDSTLLAGPFSGYTTGTISSSTFCIEPGCYFIQTTDSYGDGWQGASLLLNGSDGSSQTVDMEGALFENFTPVSFGATCGCTDADAANFDPAATADDLSCFVCDAQPVYFELITGIWASELSWLLIDSLGQTALNGNNLWEESPWTDNSAYAAWGCVTSDCYSLLLSDSYGDGWQGGSLSVSVPTDSGLLVIANGTVPPGSYDFTLPLPLDEGCPVYGCTEPMAWNYLPTASEDDGSCIRQADNVGLVNQWTDLSLPINGLNGRFSDVEGFALDGREYAIVGSTMGTHIIDLSIDGAIEELFFLPGAYGGGVTHRDYHVDGDLLFAVCDQGSSTLQCFDLSGLPDAVETIYDDDEWIRTAHNVFIDSVTKKLYACSMARSGFSSSLLVLDISDPSTPVELVNLDPWISGCHDVFVHNDTAWVNGGGIVSVLDVTNEPMLIGSIDEYPFQGSNHSGWWIPEDNVYVFADETPGSPLKVVDTSDLQDMQIIGLLSSETAPDAIAHNLMIRDDLVFVSYYHDGLQVFDISDPANPKRVAYYDTYEPDSHAGYAGAWGVHAALPSGRILISDVQSGLFVLQPQPEDIAYCPSQLSLWNGLEINAPGSWSTLISDSVWDTDIAWAWATPDESYCIDCFGDFDHDGQRTTTDLLMLLSEWSCSTDCSTDLNNNGWIDITDVLAFLALFGLPC